MRRGNISNRVSPAFMFNIDSLLFIEENKSLFETLEQAFFSLTDNNDGLFYSRKINKDLVGHLNRIYYSSDYNVYLVSIDRENEERYRTLLKNNFIPFNKLLFFDDLFSIREFIYLHPNVIQYYIDSDEDNATFIGDRSILYRNIKELYY